MTVRPEFPLSADTFLRDLQFAAVKAMVLYQAQTHDLPVTEEKDTVTIETDHGLLSFAAEDGGLRITACAEKPDWLFMLKEGVMDSLSHALPDAAATLRWSDAEQASGLPPNFHFATVESVRPVGTAFLRVRLQSNDLSSFQDDAIHFRVVLPPADLTDVEWPHVSENGSTVWPKGEKALHRPVYTTRWIDHAQGLMDFDVFVHEGGRVTDWASAVQPGAQVALIGPGGGGIPDTNRILMFADETALPAVARILEALPSDTIGHVTVQTNDGAHCAYPLSAPKAVSVTWLEPEDRSSMADQALEMMEEFPEHFLWFACEKSDVQKVRAAFKAKSGEPAQAYIAAYWTRG